MLNRRFVVLGGCLTAFAFPSLSQQAGVSGVDAFKPYLQVKTVPGEERNVRAFFSPACPYSRQYFQFFKNLEATLPSSKVFKFTPLVNSGDGVQFALAFFAVQRFYPTYLHNFMEASFIGVQDKNMVTTSWLGINKIGTAARIPVPLTKLIQEHLPEVRADVIQMTKTQAAFEVMNTPAVVVAGTYVVTPELTNGDVQVFSSLVNGLISMVR